MFAHTATRTRLLVTENAYMRLALLTVKIADDQDLDVVREPLKQAIFRLHEAPVEGKLLGIAEGVQHRHRHAEFTAEELLALRHAANVFLGRTPKDFINRHIVNIWLTLITAVEDAWLSVRFPTA